MGEPVFNSKYLAVLKKELRIYGRSLAYYGVCVPLIVKQQNLDNNNEPSFTTSEFFFFYQPHLYDYFLYDELPCDEELIEKFQLKTSDIIV